MPETKIDLKKELKYLYTASAKTPAFIEVPEHLYLMIDGKGDPGDALYQNSVGTLYSVAYAIKFLSKKQGQDFVVMPLEGLWWADDMNAYITNDRNNWLWTALIAQPYWITNEIFTEAVAKVATKNNSDVLEKVRMESLREGPSAQILHLGPYSEERATIEKLRQAIHEKGNFDGRIQKHHEIYLGDPRKTAPAKLKTIIRQSYIPFQAD